MAIILKLIEAGAGRSEQDGIAGPRLTPRLLDGLLDRAGLLDVNPAVELLA
jgi:hypothetical protein